jgi:hypothetical protein
MVKSIIELKELIVWARSQRLKSLKLGDIALEFSELVHVESLPNMLDEPTSAGLETPASTPKLPNGNAEIPEDEQLLYWSTR